MAVDSRRWIGRVGLRFLNDVIQDYSHPLTLVPHDQVRIVHPIASRHTIRIQTIDSWKEIVAIQIDLRS